MANDVALFEGMNNVPAHLQGGELSETAKALGGGTGQALKRISIKGSVFRMMVGSQEVASNEDRGMNMIIVRSAPGWSRTYYQGKYQEGVAATPACWSDDGNAPSSNVENPQSTLCASCPQNVKGSAEQGTGKACRYSARLAVVLEGDPKGDIYGIQVPGTSIFGEAENPKYDSLQDYVKKLTGFGYDVVKVVTEFRFDTKATGPRLMFRALRPLEADEWEAIKKAGESAEAKAHTSERSFAKKDSEEKLKAEDGFEKPKAQAAAEPEEVEPIKVSKKKEPVVTQDGALSDILDEWGDD